MPRATRRPKDREVAGRPPPEASLECLLLASPEGHSCTISRTTGSVCPDPPSTGTLCPISVESDFDNQFAQ